jgi:hypothetical protein
VIATMKVCFFPCFYCKQTYHCPNRMQIDMPTMNH